MKLLGIDFGLKNLGCAVSQAGLVEPLESFRYRDSGQALQRLAEICRQNQIEKIIFGLPEGELGQKVKRLAEALRKKTGLRVDFEDETLSSQNAIRKMVEAHKPVKKRRSQEHEIAACLILESYLDFQKEKL